MFKNKVIDRYMHCFMQNLKKMHNLAYTSSKHESLCRVDLYCGQAGWMSKNLVKLKTILILVEFTFTFKMQCLKNFILRKIIKEIYPTCPQGTSILHL